MFSYKRSKLNRLLKKATSLYTYRQNNQVADDVMKKEQDLYLAMARLNDKLIFNRKFPNAKFDAMVNYRAAAVLGDIEAQFILGERLSKEGSYWLDKTHSIYDSANYAKYAAMLFEQAFGFFDSASKAEHAKAKRMKGLCLINGWGTNSDTEQGLKLIVDSIEQEGNWEKASQIFSELGLNKPEFFSAIMSHKKTSPHD